MAAAQDGKNRRPRSLTAKGRLFPEYFSNREGFRPTLRIDSKLIAEAESDDPNATRSEAAEALRQIVDSVGKPGKPGEKIRLCRFSADAH